MAASREKTCAQKQPGANTLRIRCDRGAFVCAPRDNARQPFCILPHAAVRSRHREDAPRCPYKNRSRHWGSLFAAEAAKRRSECARAQRRSICAPVYTLQVRNVRRIARREHMTMSLSMDAVHLHSGTDYTMLQTHDLDEHRDKPHGHMGYYAVGVIWYLRLVRDLNYNIH